MVGSPCLARPPGLEEVPCRKVSLCWTVILGQEKALHRKRSPCWGVRLVLKETPGQERGPCWAGGPRHPAPSPPPRASLASHLPLAQTSCPAGCCRRSGFLSSIKENSDSPSHFPPRRKSGVSQEVSCPRAAGPSACDEPGLRGRTLTLTLTLTLTRTGPGSPGPAPWGLGWPLECRFGRGEAPIADGGSR